MCVQNQAVVQVALLWHTALPQPPLLRLTPNVGVAASSCLITAPWEKAADDNKRHQNSNLREERLIFEMIKKSILWGVGIFFFFFGARLGNSLSRALQFLNLIVIVLILLFDKISLAAEHAWRLDRASAAQNNPQRRGEIKMPPKNKFVLAAELHVWRKHD